MPLCPTTTASTNSSSNRKPPPPPPPGLQVLCGSEQQLREAEHEAAVMRQLRHPCLLPLVDAATQLQRTSDGSSRHVVLMLFPGGWMRRGCCRLPAPVAPQPAGWAT